MKALANLRINTRFYIKTLVLVLPALFQPQSLFGAEMPALNTSSECVLFFNPECVYNQLIEIKALNATTTPTHQISEELQFQIALVATEVLTPQKIQNRTWPYIYRDKRVKNIKKLLSLPLFSTITQQITEHSQTVRNLIAKGHNYEFSFKECMSLKQSWFDNFTASAFCSSPQMLREHLSRTNPLLKNLSNSQKIIMFKHIYANEVEFSYQEETKDTASQLIYMSAGEEKELRVTMPLFLAQTLIAYGHPEKGLEEINSIAPNTKNALEAMNILNFYQDWAQFLIEAQKKLSNTKPSQPDSIQLTKLMEIPPYSSVVDFIEQQNIELQLEMHLMIAKSIFYTGFNRDAAADLIFAYHSKKIADSLNSLSDINKIEFTIRLLAFELKAGTYIEHQSINLRTNQKSTMM